MSRTCGVRPRARCQEKHALMTMAVFRSGVVVVVPGSQWAQTPGGAGFVQVKGGAGGASPLPQKGTPPKEIS